MNVKITELVDWSDKVALAFWWCQTNLAPGTWRYRNSGEFDFDNGKDATLFRLKWS